MKLNRRTLIIGAALTATLLAGCGGEDTSTSASASAGGNTKIKVAVVPVADVMPMYLGVSQGIFEKHGLEVEIMQSGGAAAAVPLLLNGEVQFAYGGFQPIVTAASQGVPISIVSGGIARAETPETDIAAIVVKADSPLESMKDLPGHTLAVNALRGGPEFATRVALDKAGLDSNGVTYVEVPLPETIETLQQGRVEAAYVPEPFRTQAIAAGLKVIGAPIYESVPAGSTSAYFSSKQYIGENAKVLANFRAALTEATAYAKDNPDAARAQLVEVAKIPAEVADQINLPNFDAELSEDSLQDTITRLKALGWIDTEPSLNDLVAP